MAPLRCLDCTPTPSTLAQSKERKGSNFAIWQLWLCFDPSYPSIERDGEKSSPSRRSLMRRLNGSWARHVDRGAEQNSLHKVPRAELPLPSFTFSSSNLRKRQFRASDTLYCRNFLFKNELVVKTARSKNPAQFHPCKFCFRYFPAPA